MSVINQMLRELDARGSVAADVPATPPRPVGAGRRSAWRALGWTGLAAAGGAAVYWALPVVLTTDAPQDVPVIARQEAKAANMLPDVTAPAVQPVPQPAGEAAAGPSTVALQHAQKRMPAGGTAQETAKRSLPVPSVPTVAFLPADQNALQAEPAVVKNMTVLSPEAEAQQHYDDAQALRRAGKQDAAMGKYRQALERNPGMTGARLQLAGLLQAKGQADAALELLKAGFELRADDGLAIAAGRQLADLGQREAALDWLQRGQAGLRPADHALMGALLSQGHRHEEASRAYQRALAADPGQGGWLLGLGVSLEAQGRSDEARTAYRAALDRGQFKPEVTQFLRERSGFSGP
ncbi:MAG: tetratricopeptide repeat protein [Thiobacillus sp.]|nr:tetratricopeptide repeat protein [Thiobacillus sp.]